MTAKPASRSGGPQRGVPYFATSSRHAVRSEKSSTSSAVSVSRSLTFISGNEPNRSATAMRKIAVRWNTRIASSIASTSRGASASRARAAPRAPRATAACRTRGRRAARRAASVARRSGAPATSCPRRASSSRSRAAGFSFKQREVGAAPADGAKHRQHALEALQRRRARVASAWSVRTITAAKRCRPTSSMRWYRPPWRRSFSKSSARSSPASGVPASIAGTSPVCHAATSGSHRSWPFAVPGHALELRFDDCALVLQALIERVPARLVQRIREPRAVFLCSAGSSCVCASFMA